MLTEHRNIVQYEEDLDDEVENSPTDIKKDSNIQTVNDSEFEEMEDEAVGVINSPRQEQLNNDASPISAEEDFDPKEGDTKWVNVKTDKFYNQKQSKMKQGQDIEQVDNSSDEEGSTRFGNSDDDPSSNDQVINPYASVSLEKRAEEALERDIQDSKEEFAMSCRPDSSLFDENKVDFSLVSGNENTGVKFQSDAIFAKASLKNSQDPIPLNCTWYNIPEDDGEKSRIGLQLIEHCTGACFQPSIEDIGKKVCVHAMPHDLDTEDEEYLGDGQYVGMPLFAEIGPLTLDPQMEKEVDQTFKQISDNLDFPTAFRSPRTSKNEENGAGSDEHQPIAKEKMFKIMSINEVIVNGEKQSEQLQMLQVRRSSTLTSYSEFTVSDEKEKEQPENQKKSNTCIDLLKKNLKVPTSMKLTAIMTSKFIEIYRKKLNNDYESKNALVRINYDQSLTYEIIRHSNTLLVLKSKSNSMQVHMTLESSYQRDVFVLLLQKLKEHYIKEISRVDLTEVDFYKRRESYLERQLQLNILAGKDKEKNNATEIKMLKQQLSDKETVIESMKMPSHVQEMQAMAVEDATSKLLQANEKIAKLEEQFSFATQQLDFERQDKSMYQEECKKLNKKLKKMKKTNDTLENSFFEEPITPSKSRQSLFMPTIENPISEGNPDNLSDMKRSVTLSKSFWAAQHKTCQYVQTEQSIAIVPSIKFPIQRVLPIPLFCNYPSLPINFVKVLPWITPDQISSDIFLKHERSLFNQSKSSGPANDEDQESLKTKLNRLKKLNKSLTKENMKLRDSQNYSAGFKDELLFNNSDKENDNKKSYKSGGKRSENQCSSPRSSEDDFDNQSQKTDLESDNNENDSLRKPDKNEQPEVARNISVKGEKQNNRNKGSNSKQSEQATDQLSMAESQMKNQLSTISTLVEENNHMKEQIQQKIQDANHFKFLASEYEQVMKEETTKSNQYKQIMLMTQQTFKQGVFTSANTQQMQKLINQLTMALTERDEEIQLQTVLNRQLKQSLDEVTRTPEQRSQTPQEYLESKRKGKQENGQEESEEAGEQAQEGADQQRHDPLSD